MNGKTLVRCYVTKNRRAPFIGLIGEWPSRAGFTKMARAGHRFMAREATPEEIEQQANSPRHICHRWTSLLELVRWHRQKFGQYGQGVLIKCLRKNWWSVKRCLEEGQKKQRAHARKLAARREAA
jgi:hypothetical protein